MLTVSHDAEAGTLYWYFTEIVAGGVAEELECASLLLLDAQGQVIGVELELDDSINREDLTLALSHPLVRYDRAGYLLTLLIADEEPAEVRPLEDLAVLDMDAAGSLLGCEVYPAPEFGLAERLVRLAPFMVDLEADEEDTRQATGERVEDSGLKIEDSDAILYPLPSALPPLRSPGLSAAASPTFRSGFVAIVGRPNVGKSTLLNALLGEKVAIVSPKPQTTRAPLRGILNLPDAQVIFVDTPGIHTPRNRLASMMVDQARRAIPDADVVCFMVDITTPPGQLDTQIAALVRRARGPRLLVLNKVDQPHRDGQQHLEAYRALGPWDTEIALSALRREGLDLLLDEVVQRLPLGSRLYPEGQLTDQSLRLRAAELVREQVLRLTEQEVPHGVAVEVEEWEEKDAATYIRMTIYVEKDSQKGIVIGAKGAMLKEVGSRARKGIEAATGRTAYLELWVKVRPNWRDDPSALHWLGYSD